MKQEEKELLLKDLCSRLPYNVAIDCKDEDSRFTCYLTTDILKEIQNNTCHWEYKPYLFPLSSMTSELKEEFDKVISITLEDLESDEQFSCKGVVAEIDFYHKYHLDVNGLIEKGLAIDATGLNIY